LSCDRLASRPLGPGQIGGRIAGGDADRHVFGGFQRREADAAADAPSSAVAIPFCMGLSASTFHLNSSPQSCACERCR